LSAQRETYHMIHKNLRKYRHDQGDIVGREYINFRKILCIIWYFSPRVVNSGEYVCNVYVLVCGWVCIQNRKAQNSSYCCTVVNTASDDHRIL
jgi:hypothetical protein